MNQCSAGIFIGAFLTACWSPAILVTAWQPSSIEPLPATQPGLQANEIEQLVADLGSDDFGLRRAAAERLIEIGAPSLAYLDQHKQADDHETRLQILRIARIIRRDQLAIRINKFVNEQGELPGWRSYWEISGISQAQRENYAELYRDQHETLDKIDRDDCNLQEMLSDLVADFENDRRSQNRLNESTVAVIALVFAKLFADVESAQQVPTKLQTTAGRTLEHHQVHALISAGNHGPLIRQAIIRWIRCEDGNLIVMPARLSLGRQHQMKEALHPALTCLRSDKIPSSFRREAIRLVAQFGDSSHLQVLESVFKDDTSLFTRTRVDQNGVKGVYRTQVCDLALAACIFLTEQKYSDYGFMLDNENAEGKVLAFTYAGFKSDEERQAAFTKWKSFRETTK